MGGFFEGFSRWKIHKYQIHLNICSENQHIVWKILVLGYFYLWLARSEPAYSLIWRERVRRYGELRVWNGVRGNQSSFSMQLIPGCWVQTAGYRVQSITATVCRSRVLGMQCAGCSKGGMQGVGSRVQWAVCKVQGDDTSIVCRHISYRIEVPFDRLVYKTFAVSFDCFVFKNSITK